MKHLFVLILLTQFIGSAHATPSGITGLSVQTLTKDEVYGDVTLPKGTRTKTIADGTVISAELPGPVKFAGMDLKAPSKVFFQGSTLTAIELSKPQWIKGYPALKRVEFHPNSMLKQLVLSEEIKIEGKMHAAGTPLEFTVEGIPNTPESMSKRSICAQAQEKMENWIKANAPFDCKTDSDCMLQTVAPYPCGVPIAVAKPGFPESKRGELKKVADIYIKDCGIPAPNTIVCEKTNVKAYCTASKCSTNQKL